MNYLTKPIGFLVMLCVFYFGTSYLDFPWNFIDDNFQKYFYKNIYSCSNILLYKILVKVIDYIGLILKDRAAQTENKMDDQLIPFAIEIGRIFSCDICSFLCFRKRFWCQYNCTSYRFRNWWYCNCNGFKRKS